MSTVQEDFEACLEWAKVRQVSGRTNQWEPGVGGRLRFARMVFARGGFIECTGEWDNVYPLWPKDVDGETRGIIYSYVSDRYDNSTSAATFLATRIGPLPFGVDPGMGTNWGGGVGFSDPFYANAIELEGPCFIEDIGLIPDPPRLS